MGLGFSLQIQQYLLHITHIVIQHKENKLYVGFSFFLSNNR